VTTPGFLAFLIDCADIVTDFIVKINKNKKFLKELICLLSLHYLKMSFALKPASAPT
jgi:hypothetical protein